MYRIQMEGDSLAMLHWTNCQRWVLRNGHAYCFYEITAYVVVFGPLNSVKLTDYKQGFIKGLVV